MFRLSAGAHLISRELCTVWLLCLLLLCAVTILPAQCPVTDDDPNVMFKRPARVWPPGKEPPLPEAGYLTNTHYTSQFFGIDFDLPLTVQGHEIMMPIMPDKQHALLALQYEKGEHTGYIIVTATDPQPGQQINTPDKQRQVLEQWDNQNTGWGQQNPFPVPSFLLNTGRFNSSTHRSGRNTAIQYWTGINNYMVKVVIGGNDPDFLHKAKSLMADAKIYCPQDDGSLITKEGRPVKIEGAPYYGPTVPTFRVNAALRDEQGKKIPEGEVVDGVYRNSELGMRYQLPTGWAPLPPDKSDPPPIEASALRIYRFLHACSQTLLTAGPQLPGKEQPAPMIVLRALDPNCLSMHTATSLTDKRTLDSVAASLEEMKEFGEISTDELMSMRGHLFMVFQGTLAMGERGEDLGVRMSQSIFATRYNKMLLMWSMIAADRDALKQVPVSNIVFEGSPPIALKAAVEAKQ
jgi:hypothetical protein